MDKTSILEDNLRQILGDIHKRLNRLERDQEIIKIDVAELVRKIQEVL